MRRPSSTLSKQRKRRKRRSARRLPSAPGLHGERDEQRWFNSLDIHNACILIPRNRKSKKNVHKTTKSKKPNGNKLVGLCGTIPPKPLIWLDFVVPSPDPPNIHNACILLCIFLFLAIFLLFSDLSHILRTDFLLSSLFQNK